MFQKSSLLLFAIGAFAIGVGSANANVLVSATATANCQGYNLSVNAAGLTVGTSYTINYSFTVTCGNGSSTTIPGSITFTATDTTATETATGTWNGGSLSNSCQVFGTATLASSGSTVFININGQGDVPAQLMCSSLTLACPLNSGTVGVPYNSAWVPSGGSPPYSFSLLTSNATIPPGLTPGQVGANAALTGIPTTAGTYSSVLDVTDSVGNVAFATCGITIAPTTPQPVCSTGPNGITYNLHESSQNASEIVWFNSHFKLQGTIPTSTFTVTVANGSIAFGPVTLTVPNAVITFSSSATCASTTFNTSANQWETTLPLSVASQADEIFAAGLAYVLPAGFAQNIQGVTWTATFTASVPSLDFQWQWGAANYISNDSKGNVFPMTGGAPDYNAMMIKPGHNVPTCAGYNTGDHAGTPENAAVKALVVGGGSGGGGSNWTGSWSSTQSPVCTQ